MAQHNLPEEYLLETPELVELINSCNISDVCFYRNYESADGDKQGIYINHGRSRDRYHTNQIVGRGTYKSFAGWGVDVNWPIYFDGFGDSPLTALINAIFEHGLKEASLCTR